MKWVIDAGPLTPLAALACQRPSWNWPAETLHVAGAVYDEADSPNPHAPRHQLLRRAAHGGPWICKHDLALGSAAERMYSTYLRPAQANADRNEGEDQSIALCAHELTDAVFVSGDARATFIALAELGRGRVATAFDLWLDLEKRGFIDRTERDELAEATVRGLRQLLPGTPSRLG